jgi:hypothetical protein
MIVWRSLFDEAMAAHGPPAIFCLDHKGRLGLDEARSRESWSRLGCGGEFEHCHCVFEDRATGWHQYVLATSALLCGGHPRAAVHRFETMEQALAFLSGLGPIPKTDG